jgi:hypothetical protein
MIDDDGDAFGQEDLIVWGQRHYEFMPQVKLQWMQIWTPKHIYLYCIILHSKYASSAYNTRSSGKN